MSIFCYQCEEAAGGRGCSRCGCCGKDEKIGNLQNVLLAWCKHIASSVVEMHEIGAVSTLVDKFLLRSLYLTMTNVCFDQNQLIDQIFMAYRVKQVADLLGKSENLEFQASLEEQAGAPVEIPEGAFNELTEQGKAYNVDNRQSAFGPTAAGLQELVLAGIKGTASYTWHAEPLIQRTVDHLELDIRSWQREIKGLKTSSKDRARKTELNRTIAETRTIIDNWSENKRALLDGLWAQLAFLATDPTDTEALTAAALEVGKLNLLAMEQLEKAHLSIYGQPEPTVVRVSPVAGKCILVSGHDLTVLQEVLEEVRGKDINVYTHGELLPAHAYPKLKRYPNLVGHYGGAWHLQTKEFGAFPGAILVTSNCLQEPDESYQDYIFSTNPVSSPRVQPIPLTAAGRHDYTPLIRAALDSPGFFKSRGNDRITVGFGADAVCGIFELIEKAIQQSYLKRFYVIAGCDGHEDSRDYYTQLARLVPENGMILTFGCGKFRFNREDIRPLASGLPRLLDMGQCNDAYGAIRLVRFLVEKLHCGIEQLPLSIYLSWYEQKAVAILLSLLSLGFTNIHIGPTLPAFITEEAFSLLADRFQLKPITTPQQDLKG